MRWGIPRISITGIEGGKHGKYAQFIQSARNGQKYSPVCVPDHCHDRIQHLLYHGGRAVCIQPDWNGRAVRHQPDRAGHRADYCGIGDAGNRRQRRGHEEDGGAAGAGSPAGFYAADSGERRCWRGDDAPWISFYGQPAGRDGAVRGGVRILPRIPRRLSDIYHPDFADVQLFALPDCRR